jgi:hypothetical protein
LPFSSNLNPKRRAQPPLLTLYLSGSFFDENMLSASATRCDGLIGAALESEAGEFACNSGLIALAQAFVKL